MPLNLVFVITDHQRADSIGMTQCGQAITPNLNTLATRGTHFRRAYTTAPLSIPARTALATGLYPTANGVTINNFDPDAGTPNVLISQRLADAGYAVAQIGKHDIRVKPHACDQPPDGLWIGNEDYHQYLIDHEVAAPRYDETFRKRYYKHVTEYQVQGPAQSRYSKPSAGVWEPEAKHFRDWFFYRRAREFMMQQARAGQPFALFLALPSPHPPLVVPEPHASLFDPAGLDLPGNVDQPARGEPENLRRGTAAQLAEGATMDEHRRAWAAHLGLVRLADDVVGRLLDDLVALGIDDNTAVIFTSDHGHHLGQHRMFGINELYEQTVHVPLILRVPGGKPRVINELVNHLDVSATLLDLAGLAVPDVWTGRSLAPTVTQDAALPDRPMFMQFSGQLARGDTRRGVVTQRYKYIHDPTDIAELYDLERDPLEMNNLAGEPDHADIQRELHQQCAAWHKAQGDWVDYDT